MEEFCEFIPTRCSSSVTRASSFRTNSISSSFDNAWSICRVGRRGVGCLAGVFTHTSATNRPLRKEQLFHILKLLHLTGLNAYGFFKYRVIQTATVSDSFVEMSHIRGWLYGISCFNITVPASPCTCLFTDLPNPEKMVEFSPVMETIWSSNTIGKPSSISLELMN